MKRLSLIALVLLIGGTARGDFVLTGNDHLEVNSSHLYGVLNDFSTVDVVDGAWIPNIYVYDEASLRMFGGDVGSGGALNVYNAGKVYMSGGEVDDLLTRDAGEVYIAGGGIMKGLGAWGASTISISDGYISSVRARGDSIISISGGYFPDFQVYGACTVDISGGNIPTLQVKDDSVVNISGGNLGSLHVNPSSRVTFYGYDFRVIRHVPGSDLSVEGESVSGRYGILMGKWLDGTSWGLEMNIMGFYTKVRVVPEPSTLILLSMGAVGLLAYAWRKRRRR